MTIACDGQQGPAHRRLSGDGIGEATAWTAVCGAQGGALRSTATPRR